MVLDEAQNQEDCIVWIIKNVCLKMEHISIDTTKSYSHIIYKFF